MNANRLFNMILHHVMRRLLGRGIDAGIERVTRGRGSGQVLPEGRGKAGGPGDRKAARQRRQAMRVARRIGRF